MSYEEDRKRKIRIFEDTMLGCERRQDLVEGILYSREHTVLYKNPLRDISPFPSQMDGSDCEITVTKCRSLEAAGNLHKVYPDARIGVLNFASATTPGGGVIRGSSAQEECLCRCSTLYPCLETPSLQKEYYGYHRRRKDGLYTNAVIFTPEITVVKTDTKWPEWLPESDYIKVDVLSCAAPNRRGDWRLAGASSKELEKIFENRIRGIFAVALHHEIEVLVLGAFGCGAFGNPALVVAKSFRKVLKEYAKYFCHIEFAVYCSPRDSYNYEVFSKEFLS